jgi:hypothetical protein
MKMPFGKYKGTEVSKLPSSYIRWLKTIQLQGELERAVESIPDSSSGWKTEREVPKEYTISRNVFLASDGKYHFAMNGSYSGED